MQDKKRSDLEMLVILKTFRRDKVLQALKDLDKHHVERFGYDDWVIADVDTFKGGFQKEQFRDLLLDHLLLLEEGSGHVALRRKGGEVFDFDEERKNLKQYDVCSLQTRIYASGITNLVALYQFFNIPVVRQWQEFRPTVRSASNGLGAIVDYSVTQDNFQELVDIFGQDLPIRYTMAEISKNGFDPLEVRDTVDKIKETYAHPKAVQVISQRYLSEDLSARVLELR